MPALSEPTSACSAIRKALNAAVELGQLEPAQAALTELQQEPLPFDVVELSCSGVLQCLLQLLQSRDKPSGAAAARLLARFAAMRGPLQTALATSAVADTLLGVVMYEQRQAATARPTTPSVVGAASAPKAAPASKAAPPAAAAPKQEDDEEEVMGKVLLEAALRCMASLACAAPAVVIKLQQAGTPPVLALLAHPSPRIQIRALRLLLVLMRAPASSSQAAAPELLPTLLKLAAASTSPSVQISAIKLLARLSAETVQQEGLLFFLMNLLLEAPPPAAAAVAPALSGPAAAAIKKPPVAGSPVDARQAAKAEVQAAAGMLLAQCCRNSWPLTQQMLDARGLHALAGLLTDAMWGAPAAALPQPPPPVQRRETLRPASAARVAVAAVAAPAQRASTPPSPQSAQASVNGTAVCGSIGGTGAAVEAFKLPVCKAQSAEVQAAVLAIVAAVASWPQGSAALLAQHRAGELPWAALLLQQLVQQQPVLQPEAAPSSPKQPGCGQLQSKQGIVAHAVSCLASLMAGQPLLWTLELAAVQAPWLAQVVGSLVVLELESLRSVVEPAVALAASLAFHISAEEAQECGLVQLIQALSKVPEASPHAATQLARAALVLPERLFVAPPRPPLPSPPPTPPPAPMPTSMFAWDALGRPAVVGGK